MSALKKGGGNEAHRILERPDPPPPIPTPPFPRPLHAEDLEGRLRRADARSVALEIACLRVLQHLKLHTRWPCPECDRPDPDADSLVEFMEAVLGARRSICV